MLVDAIELHRKTQLSLWDALIVQAAIGDGCDRLDSEDLNRVGASARWSSSTPSNRNDEAVIPAARHE
jgi:hypothetical protein